MENDWKGPTSELPSPRPSLIIPSDIPLEKPSHPLLARPPCKPPNKPIHGIGSGGKPNKDKNNKDEGKDDWAVEPDPNVVSCMDNEAWVYEVDTYLCLELGATTQAMMWILPILNVLF